MDSQNSMPMQENSSTFECTVCFESIPKSLMCLLEPCNHSDICLDCTCNVVETRNEMAATILSLSRHLTELPDPANSESNEGSDERSITARSSEELLTPQVSSEAYESEPSALEGESDSDNRIFSCLKHLGNILYSTLNWVHNFFMAAVSFSDIYAANSEQMESAESYSLEHDDVNENAVEDVQGSSNEQEVSEVPIEEVSSNNNESTSTTKTMGHGTQVRTKMD